MQTKKSFIMPNISSNKLDCYKTSQLFSFVDACLQNKIIENSYTNVVSSPISWDFFIERLGFRDYHLYLAAAVIAFSTNVAFFSST